MPTRILLISDNNHQLTELVTQASSNRQRQLSVFSLQDFFEAKPLATDLMICNGGCYPIEALYQHLLDASPGCPVIIVSNAYRHQENQLFAGLSDRYYLVMPDTAEAMEQYLERFDRSQINLMRRLQHLFDNELGQQMNETSIISMADVKGRITYVNQRFCDISGYQTRELLGQNHRLLKSSYHPDEFYQDMWNTIRNGHSWQGRVCNRRKDGSLYWVKSVIHPIKDGAGKPCLYLSIREDISREFAFEQQLIEKDETLLLCNEYGRTFPFEWCFSDNIIRCNNDMSELLGQSQPVYELSQRQLLNALHPQDRRESLNHFRQALTDDEHEFSTESRWRRRDGSHYWLRLQGKVMVDKDHKPIKMLGAVTDIQDLKVAQSNEREANLTKSNFITSLAHEIRNPINAIFGYSQLIEQRPDAPGNRNRAKQIGEVCEHVTSMINDIGDLSLLDHDTMNLELQPLRVSNLIDRAYNIIAPLLGDISLDKNAIDDDLYVYADQQRCVQILVNLLSNAIKYNRRNGRVKLWADSDAERIKILVEDSGEGMSESDLARIFNPFERLKWQQSEIKGLGLGLPLSKKLAQKMSGDLELESHVGQGTRVWLELPRSEAPAAAEPTSSNSREVPAQHQAAQHQAATLLLVEDDPFNQEFMADHIKSLGHTLLLAGNGCEALELLDQQQVDLIITDCNMPEMDGLTLCRAIRSEKSGKHKHTPIIATTALTNDANLQACKAAGVNKALHKPVDLKALTNSINLLLSQSNQLLPTHQAPASSHSSQSLSSIDHSTLEDYVGDKPLLRTRLLKTYLTLISSDIPKLLRAFHRQDMSAASKLAHKLRPASITVGARPLASLLHRIETMDLNNPADLYPDIQRLRESTGDLFDAINHLIHQQQSPDKTRQSPSSPNDDYSQIRVLVIDDSLFSAEHARELLHDSGVNTITIATSVEQALLQLQQRSFDVILLDLNLPDVDGLQLIRLLSEHQRGQSFIIYSSQTSLVNSAKELIEQYHMNFLGHINKPMVAADITRCLNAYTQPKRTRQPAHKNKATAEEVESALRQRQLKLCYQPQIFTHNRELCSVEVLARLIDNRGNIISPAEFIPLIEQLKLHTLLSISVAEIAVAQLAQWKEVTPDLNMSINFSMAAFDDLNLPNKLLSICEAHDVNTKQITIEVTESEITENPKISTEVMARLRLLGFTLSIDDFGTGYASMEKLQKYPFTELKLDKSYVSNARNRKISLAIMKSSIELAKQLKMLTVAEGVESLDDYHFAREIGVDIIQGFYISKPVDASEIENLLLPSKIQLPR